jgi:hemerythrin-like metal-binding protein
MTQLLTNMRLAKRLALSFGSLTVIALAMVAIAWWGINRMDNSMVNSRSEFMQTIKAKNLAIAIDNIAMNLWNMISATETAEQNAFMTEVNKHRETYKTILAELKVGGKVDENARLIKAVEDAVFQTRDVNDRVIELAMKNQDAEAVKVFSSTGGEKRKKIEQAVTEFVSWHEKQLLLLDEEANRVVKQVQRIMIVAGVAALILALAFGIMITRSIANPIRTAVDLLGAMSNGDLTQDVPPELSARKDEAGDLARAMHNLTTSLRRLLGDINDGIDTLASASTDLTSVSGKTAIEVKGMAEKANLVAAAAEESSANTVSVAASMEEASTNLGSVAAATEEMSATVADIASNSEKARVISEQAIGQTQSISTLMQQLGKAAHEIGKVTETINDISSQTNLLALNATIEAARAGAAGKGFAVVANEIKELARQTATATEDIKAKISGVQTSAGGAISDIEKIATVINDVGGIVANIAAAIEEQATVTKDVAGNIAQASTGVKEANTRVAQTATVSSSIAQDIATVNKAVSDVRQGGERVQASASELSLLAEQLKEVAGQFRTNATGGHRSKTTRSEGRPIAPWKAEYTVGVDEMDSQHKRILDLINQLHAALKRGESGSAMGTVLKDLIKYTEFHFAEEEEILERVHYAELPAQRKAHVALVSKLKEAQKRWEAGDVTASPEVMNLVATWLPQHILKMDKQYGPAVNRA